MSPFEDSMPSGRSGTGDKTVNGEPDGGINNEIYDELKERWYDADDDPVALLRAEARFRNPWISGRIRRAFPDRSRCRILDIGCGGGFLANALAGEGHEVIGIDSSVESLRVARRHDPTRSVRYIQGDAYQLPFPDGSFDVVCAMDFLEHVANPARAVEEASRVLAREGRFFFYTFNRNPVAWLIAIKGLEWFVRNTPERLHVYRLFIRPAELSAHCARAGLRIDELRGIRPRILSRAMLRLLLTGRVDPCFPFVFTPSPLVAYLGVAGKHGIGDAEASPGGDA